MSYRGFNVSRIPVSSRQSFIYLECGYLEVDGAAMVFRQGRNDLIHVPCGLFVCILVGPGVVVTHEAIKACSHERTLLVWVGEQGVRCYSVGQPGGSSGEAMLAQAALALDERKRLDVARRLYGFMFGADPPQGRSIDQLRGIEGARVKQGYMDLAKKWGVRWDGRSYDVNDFSASDSVNKAISCATTCLYGLAEAVVVSLGYSPAIGFIHRGDARSFVFDVADTLKMESVLPVAFEQASKGSHDLEGRVRAACRDLFREVSMAGRLVTVTEEVLAWRSSSSK